MTKSYDYIITGMGAAGLILALKMSKDSFFNKKKILLIDKSDKDLNDKTWCFWQNNQYDLEELVTKQWSTIGFKGANFDRNFDIEPFYYKHIKSIDLYAYIIDILQKKDNFFFQKTITRSIKDKGNQVIVDTDLGAFSATRVFNSIHLDYKFRSSKRYPLLNQHFIGWFVKTKTDYFDEKIVDFMDFSVPQLGNTRFMYVLPYTNREALVEYTLFSKELLKKQDYEQAIRDYLEAKGIFDYELISKESGCIPMTCYPFWKTNSQNLIHIGTAGGWTKASTGFTFSTILKKSDQLIAFIKSGSSLVSFHRKNRFWFYDLLFLDFLAENNDRGKEVFTRMFRANPPKTILRFLDEETTFVEELKIMASMPKTKFIGLFFKRLTKQFF